jgi:hypothetical protein
MAEGQAFREPSKPKRKITNPTHVSTGAHIHTHRYRCPDIAGGLRFSFLNKSERDKDRESQEMPYKVVINNNNPITLKKIAEAENIEYQQGGGYYELTKNESIASKKSIVLFENGNYVTDSDADIRTRCHFPAGDLNISSSDLPPNTQLFIQSTAPNRKIPTGSVVLFYVDDDGTTVTGSSSSASAAPPIQYAIKYDELFSDHIFDYLEGGDLASLFNFPVGVDFSDCDTPVPMAHQLPSLWYLSNLTRADWTAVDIKVETVPCITNERVTRVSATGSLTLPDATTAAPVVHPVRLEYQWGEEWSFYAVSVGMVWGALLGSCGAHPYVVTPQFNYGNSDGSSSEMPPIAVCECTERNALAATNPNLGFELQVTHSQRMDSICGHLIRTFSTHCADSDH